MRVSKAQVGENRDRILDNASRLFRGKGFDGVGVAELMQAAGLTNGAFYGHFESKDDLIGKVCGRTEPSPGEPWEQLAHQDAGTALRRFVAAYLAPEHVRGRSFGCPIAALSGDVARQLPPARRAFTRALTARLDALKAFMPGPQARRRDEALAALASLVGAVMLARAIDDPALARVLLETTAQDLRLRGRA